MRRLAVTGVTVFALAAGCVTTESLTESHNLNGVPIKTPEAKTVTPASLKTAERVQSLGQRIIDQNIFTGINPLFHTLGVPEPVLFHRGPDELFISEGLVSRCRTESQLAAVLCTEMGRMMAEKRSAKVLGVELNSVRELAEPPPLGEGEVASSMAVNSRPVAAAPVDANHFARELLRGAG